MKTTHDEIIANLNNPEILERLYRGDRKSFTAAFEELYQDFENAGSAKFWKARLDYDYKAEKSNNIMLSEIIKVISAGLLAAFLIKLPDILNIGISRDVFYQKNASIILFLGLTLYTIMIKRITEARKLILTAAFILVPAIYINILPSDEPGNHVILAFIHLPLLMWFIYGVSYINYDFRNQGKRIEFIRFNGDLAIVYALIALAGGLLTIITIGLFDSIGLDIEKFYTENIIIMGAVAAPVVAAYIIEKYPALVSRAAPVIAGIFSPLVLITLIVFIITIVVTGKDPYNDRDFLLVFNIMLLGVMGIIIFSVSETSVIRYQKFNAVILLMLSIITIIIDLIALSAIFYRLGEYGLTPNRLAVVVSNLLVLINLVLIMKDLFMVNFRNRDFKIVEMTTVKFLPVYLLWIIIVVFGFPLIF